MKWCRRDDSEYVVEVIDFDPTGLFDPSLIWHECPDDTEQRDWFNGSSYVQPVPMPPPDNLPPPPVDSETGECLISWHEFGGGWPHDVAIAVHDDPPGQYLAINA